MATPFTITQNFKHGGIRQGTVFIVAGDEGAYTATPMGRLREPMFNLDTINSEQDSQGRTTVIGYTLDASFIMMQHTTEEIAAVGNLAYPPDDSEEEEGYNVLFTDGPYTATEVEALLNDAGGRIVPGILLERVFPKPGIRLNMGISDSEIQVSIDGVLQPDALIGFDTTPVLTFA